MTRRRTARLALSEYVSSENDKNTQIWRARMQLINSSRKIYPEFLETLLKDVFPLYSELADDGFDFERLLSVPTGRSPFELLGNDGLRSALTKWGGTFNVDLNAGAWILDGALLTLRHWYVARETRKNLVWFEMNPISGTSPIGKRVKFECDGWEPELWTWSDFKKLVHKCLDNELRDYEKETRTLAEECGLVRAQKKYSQDNFEWFVLSQFAGLSCTAIAQRTADKGHYVDDSTVLKGIKAAGKLIDWAPLNEPTRRKNRKIR